MLLNIEDDIIQPDEDIMEEQADYFYTSYEGIILDFMQLIVSSAPYITSLLITLILHLHNYKFTIPSGAAEAQGLRKKADLATSGSLLDTTIVPTTKYTV